MAGKLLTAQDLDSFKAKIIEIAESAGGGFDPTELQAQITAINDKLTAFLGTDSDTLAQIKALIALAEESGEIADLATNLSALAARVTAAETAIAGKANQSALDALTASVQGKADQTALDAVSARLGVTELALAEAIAVEDIIVT